MRGIWKQNRPVACMAWPESPRWGGKGISWFKTLTIALPYPKHGKKGYILLLRFRCYMTQPGNSLVALKVG
jgi:hypothetical protein